MGPVQAARMFVHGVARTQGELHSGTRACGKEGGDSMNSRSWAGGPAQTVCYQSRLRGSKWPAARSFNSGAAPGGFGTFPCSSASR